MAADRKRCKSGSYCTAMSAALDANAKQGMQVNLVMSLKSVDVAREVVTHAAVHEGKKRRLVFDFCPFCGQRFNKKR